MMGKLLYFTSPLCGPCKAIKVTLDELKGTYEGMDYGEPIDCLSAEGGMVANRYSVKTTPFLLYVVEWGDGDETITQILPLGGDVMLSKQQIYNEIFNARLLEANERESRRKKEVAKRAGEAEIASVFPGLNPRVVEEVNEAPENEMMAQSCITWEPKPPSRERIAASNFGASDHRIEEPWGMVELEERVSDLEEVVRRLNDADVALEQKADDPHSLFATLERDRDYWMNMSNDLSAENAQLQNELCAAKRKKGE